MLYALRVSRFKTYLGPLQVPFSRFTCMVGPNGAGKSNLVDALLFVLGADLREIRGDIHWREEHPRVQPRNEEQIEEQIAAVEIEISQKQDEQNGVRENTRVVLRRELHSMSRGDINNRGDIKVSASSNTNSNTSASIYYINNSQVTYNEYNNLLRRMHLLGPHKNFLLSQAESLSSTPKELSRTIEILSGAAELKQEYNRAKASLISTQASYAESNDRKKRTEISLKETIEVNDLESRKTRVVQRMRYIKGIVLSKILKDLQEAKIKAEERISEIESISNSNDQQKNRTYAAQIHLEGIRIRAKRAFLESQINALSQEKAKQQTNKCREEERANALKQREAEAEAHIQECIWRRECLEKVIESGLLDGNIIDAENEIANKIEVFAEQENIAEKDIIKKDIKDITDIATPPPTERSSRMDALNKELLEVLKSLAGSQQRERVNAYTARLGYHIGHLREHLPQILGRAESLIEPKKNMYRTALRALLWPKKDYVVVQGISQMHPILNALTRAGTGRVTVMPLVGKTSDPHSHSQLLLNKSSEAFTNTNTNTNTPSGYLLFSEVLNVCPEVPSELKNELLQGLFGDTLLYLGTDSVPALKERKIVTLDGIVISRSGALRRPYLGPPEEVQQLEKRKNELLEKIKECAALDKLSSTNSNTKNSEDKSEDKLNEKLNENLNQKNINLSVASEKTSINKKNNTTANTTRKERVREKAKQYNIPKEIAEYAIDNGVYNLPSAERKIKSFTEKEHMWRKTLAKITERVTVVGNTNTNTTNTPDEQSLTDSLRQVQKQEKEIEQRIIEAARQMESPLMIEMGVLREQQLSLIEQIEEVEQKLAEEGIVLNEINNSANNSVNPTNESEIEEESAKLEKELANIEGSLRGRRPIDGAAQIHSKAVSEAERDKTLFVSAQKYFQEIKKKRCTLFTDAFKRLNFALNENYKKLIGLTDNNSVNDTIVAHLGMDTPNEPYLGGIKVFIMPTGKTFRETKYLSGGEKAVAALALLLALHRDWPSPFYVLDEMDAPLDKDRISLLRQALTQVDAQFIAVTHRIELFEGAETLVGIARPPGGNSQVYTLRLQ